MGGSRRVAHSRASMAVASLARLWPHRVHESNWLTNLLCRLGVHHWHRLALDASFPVPEANFCRRCDAVVLAGVRSEGQRMIESKS